MVDAPGDVTVRLISFRVRVAPVQGSVDSPTGANSGDHRCSVSYYDN